MSPRPPLSFLASISVTPEISMPMGSCSWSFCITSVGSTFWLSQSSRTSLSAVAPRDSGRAVYILRRTANGDSSWEMGMAARRQILSHVFIMSRWPTKTASPFFEKRKCRRWTLDESHSAKPVNSGTSGGSKTTLSPNSSPHTPHSEQRPLWEQSGTVAASRAFWSSDLSHHLAMPVSMWSQGRGASRRASAMVPLSTRPLPPAPWPLKRSSPRFSMTSHSPSSTWRYFHSMPASSIAWLQMA